MEDGNYSNVIDPDYVTTRFIDVLVEAYEETDYPGGTDYNNGVYRLGYSIDHLSWADSVNITFDQWRYNYWDVDYIYNATRSCNTRYVYVITNHMDGNGRIDVQQLSPGWHTLTVFLRDEQNNLTQRDKQFYVVNTGICEDYVPPWDTLISPNGDEEFYAGGTCEIMWVA